MKRRQAAVIEALARDHALGLLSPRVQRRVEALANEWPELARAIAQWQTRLAVLSEGVAPVTPPERVWQNVQARVISTLASQGQNAHLAAPRSATWFWPPFLAHLWTMLTQPVVGMAVGAVMAVTVVWVLPPLLSLETTGDTLPAAYVGVLSDAHGAGRLVVASRRHGTRVQVKVLQSWVALPPGRTARLWAYPADHGRPFLVGSVPETGQNVLALPAPAQTLFAGVNRLAVHADMAGSASPGVLLASGPCAKLW